MVATGCDKARRWRTALCEFKGPLAVMRSADTPGDKKGPLERCSVLPPSTGEEAGSKEALTAGGKPEEEKTTTCESPNARGTRTSTSAVAAAPRNTVSLSRTMEKSLSMTAMLDTAVCTTLPDVAWMVNGTIPMGAVASADTVSVAACPAVTSGDVRLGVSPGPSPEMVSWICRAAAVARRGAVEMV